MTSTTLPPAQTPGSLDLMDTVGNAFTFVFKNIRFLPAAMCLPFVVDMFLRLAIGFGPDADVSLDEETLKQWPPDRATVTLFLWGLLIIAAQIFSICLLFIAWYRLVLLGPERAAPRYFYPIEHRHWRVFACSCGIGILIFLISAVLVVPVFVLMGVASHFALMHIFLLPVLFFLWFILPLRFSFVFPALAVDERYGPADSWRHTKKRTLVLLGGSILCILPASIVGGLLGGDPAISISITTVGTDGDGGSLLPPIATEIVSYLAGTFNTLVLAGFIAMVFRVSTGWVAEEPAI